MSTELFTPRSYPVSPRDFGSTYSCSSSEASTRLAARLERSEYKRSRGKQKLKNNYNSPRNHSRRRENRGSKRKNNSQNSLATRETRTKSEQDGVTSVWEVYRQNPHQVNVERDSHHTDTREKPNSWYAIPNEGQGSPTRPRIVHDKPSADHRDLTPHVSKLSRRQETRHSDSYKNSLYAVHGENFEHKRTYAAHKINEVNSFCKGETMNSDQNHFHTKHNRNLEKGMYLSRSLSSSFSSNVGSSDEREDSQGIYSAYDMAGRSPYDSSFHRRYSQSSLSSSNASWQHSSSSFNYNIRDIPPLLDPIDKIQESSSFDRPAGQYEHDRHFREDFRLIKEEPVKIPPPVAPKPAKYSSSYTIQLHSASPHIRKEKGIHDNTEKKDLNFVQSHPHKDHKFANALMAPKKVDSSKVDSKILSVREIAKKFTPTSIRHISSEMHTRTPSGDDAQRVKAEHWPKVVSVMHQESSPSENSKDVPPARPPYPDEKGYNSKGVVMRNKEETHKNPEELASHRLSLQELIRLHEEQIAIQAKSAKTVSAHVYVKRSPSDSSPGRFRASEYNYFELKDLKTESSQNDSPVNKKESQKQPFIDSVTTPKLQIRHSGYEVREMRMDQNSPFKVIELTGKSFENLSTGKEKTARVKRHRTIGIVGYRHQIDRTSGEKAQAKQKRHTTVGIINDFKDLKETQGESSPSMINKDNKVNTSSNNYAIQNETADRTQGEKGKREDVKSCIPIKVFDIEKSQEPQNQAPMERSVGYTEVPQADQPDAKSEEPLVVSSTANYWYNSYPQKDLSEVEKYSLAVEKYSPTSPDNFKEDVISRNTVKEIPQSSALLPTTDDYPRGTQARNLHSPVVELSPSRKGNPTAYYKAAVPIVSHLDLSDHRSGKERASSSSNSEVKLAGFDENVIHQSKPYSVPVVQVSSVNQDTAEIIQAKAVQLASPPPEPPSAHEMYETRLAMWDLLPRQERSTGELTDHPSNEGQVSFGDKSKQSLSSKEQPRTPLYQDTVAKDYQEDLTDSKGNRFSSNYQSQTEDYYKRTIEKLKEENQRLREKNEAEKREFRRMYEEQKKVANAYQKLEDRYRRRVHELQDALANCTCQGSILVNSRKTTHTTKSDKESQSSKTQSIHSGMRIFEELEEWLTEQSKNTKASKVNATSRDSLISSSSDLTGWDDHIDGAIDQVNGTHV